MTTNNIIKVINALKNGYTIDFIIYHDKSTDRLYRSVTNAKVTIPNGNFTCNSINTVITGRNNDGVITFEKKEDTYSFPYKKIKKIKLLKI